MSSEVSHVLNPKQASSSGGKSFAFCSALLFTLGFIIFTIICFAAETLVDKFGHLGFIDEPNFAGQATFSNPLFQADPEIRSRRWFALLGLTRREADFGRRIFMSVLLGSLIGLERRAPNRPAGVRTMSLVSLGACLFTICSMYAFEDGSMSWDASRVSAALPSGVGFLGGALIFKHTPSGAKPELIGLTTASGLWLSCSVGLCCGGAQYFVAIFGTAAMVMIMRFGPRQPEGKESGDEGDDEGIKPEDTSAQAAKKIVAPADMERQPWATSASQPLVTQDNRVENEAADAIGREGSQRSLGKRKSDKGLSISCTD
eukprot:gnl/TRDRNA2_/TRDRNA2_169518_c0_seq1.p1 gnl/TRDRNA2_/TRDRNA2_169518_c0~~gnl/TRDRNA2_/TRDRNA2_169518_c0_seq1.p1  ORF type:complete len:339 (+),score=58.60 gnl/TRDRNA2_/TRDRNA2_169518_c0_seq1:70-1017(+)